MPGKSGKPAVFAILLLSLILLSGCVSKEFSFAGGLPDGALDGGIVSEPGGEPAGPSSSEVRARGHWENLTIRFISVGQGDAMLLNKGNFSALIDGGKPGSGKTIIEAINGTEDTSLELIVATHPDSDHIGGLPEVMKALNFSDVWDSGVPEETKAYLSYSEEAGRGNVIYPKAGDRFNYSGIILTVLNPPKEGNFGEKNENSVVVLVSYGEIDILLTGDCEGGCEDAISGKVPDVEILKVAHHGSKYATGRGFLLRARPEISVISVGKNSYGHPANETIGRLKDAGSEILRTDEAGTITIATDGTAIFRI